MFSSNDQSIHILPNNWLNKSKAAVATWLIGKMKNKNVKTIPLFYLVFVVVVNFETIIIVKAKYSFNSQIA